jgi:hypothetical protein
MPSYNCTRNLNVFSAESTKLVIAPNVMHCPKFCLATVVSIPAISISHSAGSSDAKSVVSQT